MKSSIICTLLAMISFSANATERLATRAQVNDMCNTVAAEIESKNLDYALDIDDCKSQSMGISLNSESKSVITGALLISHPDTPVQRRNVSARLSSKGKVIGSTIVW